MEYLKSERGGRIAVHKNFMYTKERSLGTKIYWRCKNRNCNGRLHVKDDLILYETDHSHMGDIAAVLALKARLEIKARAADTVEMPRQIIQHVTQTTPVQATTMMGAYRSVQRDIQRTRKKLMVPLPLPLTLADIDTDQRFQLSHRSSRFLFLDTGSADPNRIIMFATEDNIKILMESSIWLGDGTFDVSPLLYMQLYTIHGVFKGATIPLVYAMLPNKTFETYKRTFQPVFDGISKLTSGTSVTVGPKRMIFDFEKAASKAFSKVFPLATMQGCSFHLGQSLLKKIQNLGFAEKYASDLEFSEQCKMMLVLAYVPVSGVLGAWEALQSMPNGAFLVESDLNQYFLDTYIGAFATRSTQRKQPCFPIEFWNCYERVIEGVSRTTNGAEGWHNAFQRTVGAHHPSLYAFFDKLRTEQSFQESALDKLKAGHEPPKQKMKYRQLNERIVSVVNDYQKTDIVEYLRRISRNIAITH